jgi:hypothetical protein
MARRGTSDFELAPRLEPKLVLRDTEVIEMPCGVPDEFAREPNHNRRDGL